MIVLLCLALGQSHAMQSVFDKSRQELYSIRKPSRIFGFFVRVLSAIGDDHPLVLLVRDRVRRQLRLDLRPRLGADAAVLDVGDERRPPPISSPCCGLRNISRPGDVSPAGHRSRDSPPIQEETPG
jgi:hypothetical protein